MLDHNPKFKHELGEFYMLMLLIMVGFNVLFIIYF